MHMQKAMESQRNLIGHVGVLKRLKRSSWKRNWCCNCNIKGMKDQLKYGKKVKLLKIDQVCEEVKWSETENGIILRGWGM